MKYNLEDKEYNVEIIRKNNKNTYIRVKDDLTIYVTTSYFTTSGQVINLLDSNHKFLVKAIKKKQKKEVDTNRINYLGQSYYVAISRLMDSVQFIGYKVFTPSRQFFDEWCLNKAKLLFQERFDICYNRFEESIPYYKLKLRNMKTKWGVCNIKSKTITLNPKLLEYDLSCIDYVIIHELSHLLEFNHSKNFWNIVEKYCPEYKDIKRILKY